MTRRPRLLFLLEWVTTWKNRALWTSVSIAVNMLTWPKKIQTKLHASLAWTIKLDKTVRLRVLVGLTFHCLYRYLCCMQRLCTVLLILHPNIFDYSPMLVIFSLFQWLSGWMDGRTDGRLDGWMGHLPPLSALSPVTSAATTSSTEYWQRRWCDYLDSHTKRLISSSRDQVSPIVFIPAMQAMTTAAIPLLQTRYRNFFAHRRTVLGLHGRFAVKHFAEGTFRRKKTMRRRDVVTAIPPTIRFVDSTGVSPTVRFTDHNVLFSSLGSRRLCL